MLKIRTEAGILNAQTTVEGQIPMEKNIYDRFLELVEHDDYSYSDIDVMLFTIVELAGSTAYNSILYEEPLPFEEYKPFLYRSVRLIIKSHRVP